MKTKIVILLTSLLITSNVHSFTGIDGTVKLFMKIGTNKLGREFSDYEYDMLHPMIKKCITHASIRDDRLSNLVEFKSNKAMEETIKRVFLQIPSCVNFAVEISKLKRKATK